MVFCGKTVCIGGSIRAIRVYKVSVGIVLVGRSNGTVSAIYKLANISVAIIKMIIGV